MSTQGVVYRHSVEALIKRVLEPRGALTPGFTSTLRDLGVDPGKPRDLDLATWTKLLQTCASQLFPGQAEPDALTSLGRALLDGFTSTLVGQGALLVGKLAGPRRSLQKLAEFWKSANSIYVVTTEEKGPTHFEVRINVGGPLRYYNRGILLGALEKVNVKTGHVELHEQPGGGDLYVVTWT